MTMICHKISVLVLCGRSYAIFYEYVPACARPGVHYGAGIGAVAGGMTGAAALTGTGLGK